MTRAISIFLIVAIALQTVGCSSWRPLARMNEVPEDERQTYMREQVLGKLKEGMAVRITIRDGTPAPTTDGVIDGIIKRVGQTSFTVIPIKFYAPSNVSRELTLRYFDIESIEFRESKDLWGALLAGVGVGALLGYFIILWALSGVESD